MSQFADGGIVGTKPYAASANYMHKMSDHCQDCHYQHNKTVGENACPLNSLYWHFIDRHQTTLKDNPRMKMMYHQWQKRDPQEKQDIIEQAEQHLANINSL